jgi:hypothetical protein
MLLNVVLKVKFRIWGITYGTLEPIPWNIPIQMPLAATRLLVNYNERGVLLTVHLVNSTTDPAP